MSPLPFPPLHSPLSNHPITNCSQHNTPSITFDSLSLPFQIFSPTLTTLTQSPISPPNYQLFHSHPNITQTLISPILIISPLNVTLQSIYLCSTVRYSCDILCNVQIVCLNCVSVWWCLLCYFIVCHYNILTTNKAVPLFYVVSQQYIKN
jgi:hypothetical protein